MISTYELLEAKRNEFNTFNSTVVCPLVGLKEEEMDNLGFAEVAKRISDLDIRKSYCELVIAMLDANIVHYRPDATLISVSRYDNTIIVASTLVVAAIAQYQSGTAVALFVSAVWYWLVNETSRRSLKQQTK